MMARGRVLSVDMGQLSQKMDTAASWERWANCAQSRADSPGNAIYLRQVEPIVLATFSYRIYI